MQLCKLLFGLIILVVLSSCIQRKGKNEQTPVTFTKPNGDVFATGYVDKDTLPVSNWMYFNGDSVTSHGNYLNGRIIGEWVYNLKDFKGSINWDTLLISSNLTLSYPSNYKLEIQKSHVRLLDNQSNTEIELARVSHRFNYNEELDSITLNIERTNFVVNKFACRKSLYQGSYTYALFYDIRNEDTLGLEYNVYVPVENFYYRFRLTSRNFKGSNYQYVMTVFLSMIDHLYIGKKRIWNSTYATDSDC